MTILTEPSSLRMAAKTRETDKRSAYELVPLTSAEEAQWDELIAPYYTCELFHRRAWLDYLAESRGVDIRFWKILNGSRTLGYFCGGIIKKGPFRILGSPLKGWGTNSLGPVVNKGFDTSDFMDALDRLAADERLAMTEIENPILSERSFAEHAYEPVPGWTYIVQLAPYNPDTAWSMLYSEKRNRVRKALRSGLTVEDTNEPSVADEFYDRYLDLMRRKGLVPPYPRVYPRLVFQHLQDKGLLLALRVRDKAGRVLAVGLFPHDHRKLYFWGGASWHEGRELNPNDFLHWSAIRLSSEAGLIAYDMCGFGRFKKQFGGTLTTIKRWHKCYWRTARWARRGYELWHQKGLRIRAFGQKALH